MFESGTLPVIGVPMHCVDCKRILVSFNDDGSFIIAPLAVVETMAEEYIDEYGEVCMPKEVVVMEARCERPLCRVKRKIRNLRRK
jgi:hypothetical protein